MVLNYDTKLKPAMMPVNGKIRASHVQMMELLTLQDECRH
jgi:hypothetical protein